VFLDTLKIGKVVPIFKSNDKLLINYYQPLSILSVFSKIFQRLVYDRLNNYMKMNKSLIDNQFGFI